MSDTVSTTRPLSPGMSPREAWESVMEIDENLSSSERALLQRVAEHLRKFRYSHREDDYPPLYRDGVLAGIEMAKNEVWRLAGSRPF